MIQLVNTRYGPQARNRLDETAAATADGARAALESFYYALNQRDRDALREVWAMDPLAQLNNPLGGILRGGDAVAELYDRIFTGPVVVQVTLNDIVEYLGPEHAVFAGRETGTYTRPDGTVTPLEIRTSRYFRYHDGRWRQYHHHGSIDDPEALDAYRRSIAG